MDVIGIFKDVFMISSIIQQESYITDEEYICEAQKYHIPDLWLLFLKVFMIDSRYI